MSKKEFTPLSESFITVFDVKAEQLSNKVEVMESTELQKLEEQLRHVERQMNAARIGGVGHLGKLSEQRARLQAQIDEISQEKLYTYHAKAGADLQKKREKLDKGTLTMKDLKKGQNRVKGLNTAAAKMHEAMDPVGKADADIDNDGDVDSSDKYLHNRRKAIAKAMKKKNS